MPKRERRRMMQAVTVNFVFCVVILAILYLPTIFLIALSTYLLYYEALVMTGGFFAWLNRRKEPEYEYTGPVRRMIATNLRIVFFISYPLLVYTLVVYNSWDPVFRNKDLVSLIMRMFLIVQPLEIIHSVVLIEKITGVQFGSDPPIVSLVRRLFRRVALVTGTEECLDDLSEKER